MPVSANPGLGAARRPHPRQRLRLVSSAPAQGAPATPPPGSSRPPGASGGSPHPPIPGSSRPRPETLHRWMLTLQDARFYRTLQRVYASAGGAARWGWEPLYENRYLRCGLLWLGPGGVMPLHDHPGMVGVMVGLLGEAELERYDAPAGDRDLEGHVLLEGGTRTRLRHDDVSITDGPRGNIHGLRNPTGHPAVVLEALWHGGGTVRRHLFLPTGSVGSDRLPAVGLRECEAYELGGGLLGELTPLRGVLRTS